MLYSGIDLYKRTIAIHTVDADGAMVRKADLPTDRAAIKLGSTFTRTAYFCEPKTLTWATPFTDDRR